MNTIKEDDNFINFLKERINKASSTETQTAYTIVLTEYTKKILYTEEEVKELLLRFAEECDSNEDLICYDGHINGVRQYNDLKKWFNQNKKK